MIEAKLTADFKKKSKLSRFVEVNAVPFGYIF
jgi:hypothetical protein